MAKKLEPSQPIRWDIYKAASKSVWLGIVEASDKQAAVEKAAVEFETDPWRLVAVRR